MKSIAINELTDNFFESISKEWMLVTAGNKDAFNTMTANWGGIGFLWNKPVVYVFIRPERYTIHKICGSKSGREVDKIKETGLKPIITDKGNILFEQGRLNMECRKMYTDVLKKENFLDPSVYEQWYTTHGGLHHVYVAEITGVWIKE